MTRRHRRLVAWLGILGIAFAQVAATAHACMLRSAAPANAAMAAEGHCAGMQGAETPPITPAANACEVQCTDGAPSVAAPDLPPVALVAFAVEPAPAAMPLAESAWDSATLAATVAQPPPLLQYCRLLN